MWVIVAKGKFEVAPLKSGTPPVPGVRVVRGKPLEEAGCLSSVRKSVTDVFKGQSARRPEVFKGQSARRPVTAGFMGQGLAAARMASAGSGRLARTSLPGLYI